MSTSINSAEEEMSAYPLKVVRNDDDGSTLKTYQHSSSSSSLSSSLSSSGGKSVRFQDYVDVYVVFGETTQFGDNRWEDDVRIHSSRAHPCYRFTGCRPSQGRCVCSRLRCRSSSSVGGGGAGGGRPALQIVEHCPLGQPLVNISTEIGYDSDIETEDNDDDYNDDDDHQIEQRFCNDDGKVPPLLGSRWTEERSDGTVSASKRDVSMTIPQRR